MVVGNKTEKKKVKWKCNVECAFFSYLHLYIPSRLSFTGLMHILLLILGLYIPSFFSGNSLVGASSKMLPVFLYTILCRDAYILFFSCFPFQVLLLFCRSAKSLKNLFEKISCTEAVNRIGNACRFFCW